MNWYYRTLNPEVGEALAEIKRANVARLPIRTIDADNTRYDRMVELVESTLDLHRQITAAKTAHAKTNLRRRIDAIDTQIDKLVYELYELTPDEIKIVETGTK